MSKRLWIYGAGGLGLEVLELAHCCGYPDSRLGFLDDACTSESTLEGCVVSPGLESEACIFKPEDEVIIALGNPDLRAKLWERLASRDITSPTLIAPTAVVSRNASIEPGCIVFHYGFISALVHLAENAILNAGVMVAHHGRVGRHSVIGPGTILLGNVTVGERTELGACSRVYPGQSLGDEATVGMGSCVFKDVESGATAAGNPARTFSQKSS